MADTTHSQLWRIHHTTADFTPSSTRLEQLDTSYDYRITTPQDANVLNQFILQITFFLVVHYIGRKGKEQELEEKQLYNAYCSLQRVQKP